MPVATVHLHLPPRTGPAPRVSHDGPQTQLTQTAPPALWGQLVAGVFQIPGTVEGHSGVSPASSRAVFVEGIWEPRIPEVSLAPGRRFEPVHVHGVHDTSTHLVLDPEHANELEKLGWVTAHQYADYGTEFLLYGPRNTDELATVLAIIRESITWAVDTATPTTQTPSVHEAE